VRSLQRDIIINVPYACMRITRHSYHILMTLEFYRQKGLFEKYSIIKFHENRPVGGRVILRGRTDMTRLFLAFRNFANEPKNRWRFEAIISECKANLAPLNWIRIDSVVSPSAKYRIIWSENPHHSSFRPFRVTASSALFAAIPAGREPGSTCFTSVYYI